MPPAPTPRLAVVIPCYNAAIWIGRALRSVLEQGYEDLILIVVDDGSTDASVAEVEAFGDLVLLCKGPNRGASHARNQGVRLARDGGADYILFLDADDYLEGDLLRGAVRTAVDSGADMVLSDMHRIELDGRRVERFLYSGRVAPEVFFRNWLLGDYFIPAAILWRIRLVERLGGWDERLSRYQDLDISLRAALEQPLIVKNGQGAAIYAQVNPHSIARTVSPDATSSRIRAILHLLDRVQGTPFEHVAPLLHQRLYVIARTAFRLNQAELGRQALAELAAAGFTGHPGTWRHRLLAGLLGLEGKVRLVGH